jgi:hypothetical protein
MKQAFKTGEGWGAVCPWHFTLAFSKIRAFEFEALYET